MFITPQCGGIKLNPDTFDIWKGVITLADSHPDDPIEEVNTPCSQLYDSIIFERVKYNGVWIMTSAGVDIDIPLANIVVTQDKSIIRGTIMIDDYGENLNNFNGIRICYSQPWNKDYQGAFRYNDWNKIDLVVKAYEISPWHK